MAYRDIKIRIDEERGVVTYFDDTVVLQHAAMPATLQKMLEARMDPGAAHDVIYRAGEEAALAAISDAKRAFLRTVGRMIKRQMVEAVMNLGLERGFGVFSASPEFNYERGSGVINVTNSVVARHYGKAERPVCYYIAGIIDGAATAIYDREFEVDERMCKAIGDVACRFEVTPIESNPARREP